MKCDEIRDLIDDYHYSELDVEQAAEVAAHLRDCAGCRKELQLLESEAALYDAYAADTLSKLEIPPDMWRRVLAGSVPRPQPALEKPHAGRASWLHAWMPAGSWVRQAVAAVLLMAVSVTGTLLVVDHYRSNEGKRASIAAEATGEKNLDAALESIQRAEQEYIRAIQELNAIVEKQKPNLDPKIVAELQANLALIDNHIATARKAYYAHPKDPELALHMLAAYSSKVELLQDLTS